MWSFQGLEVFVHNNPKTDAKGVMRACSIELQDRNRTVVLRRVFSAKMVYE